MTPEEVSSALTSGLLYPTIGAILVVASWLFRRYREGVPLGQQLEDMWGTARGPLVTSVGVGASALLVEGTQPINAVALALTTFLTLTNFRSTRALPAKE